MRGEVYLVDSVARAVEEAQTIAQRRWGHFGRIRKVKPGDIKNDHRTVEVQVEVGDAKHWIVVDLQKAKGGWVVEKPREEKIQMEALVSFLSELRAVYAEIRVTFPELTIVLEPNEMDGLTDFVWTAECEGKVVQRQFRPEDLLKAGVQRYVNLMETRLRNAFWPDQG